MSRCTHEFKRNPQGEVVCILCGDKDDEMEPVTPVDVESDQDFWATQSSFE